MLLAALDATGGQRAVEIVERASKTWGAPGAQVKDRGRVMAAWRTQAPVHVDAHHGWLAEGGADLQALRPSALAEAKGDFALFALEQGGVLAAAGRAGGYRPIYTWLLGELVVASTRLSALLEVLPAPPQLDLDHLSASLLISLRPSAQGTPYAGVRCVPMGEAWLLRPGAAPERHSTLVPLSNQELEDGDHLPGLLRNAIDEAVSRSTRGTGRLGVEVSGGLDSSMIFSILARRAREGEISCPPAGFAYEAAAPSWHDDRPYLRLLEQHLGIGVHRIKPRDLSASLGDMFVVDAMPASSPMLSAARSVRAAAAAQGVDVMLTGDGGDQILDGDPRLFGELARQGEILRPLRGALRTRGFFFDNRARRVVRFLIRPLLEPLLPSVGLRAARRWQSRPPRWARPPVLRQVDRLVATAERAPSLRESPHDRYVRLLRSPLFVRWPRLRQQEEVVGGYTLRAPLLDDELLRFAARLPPLSLMRGGFLRGLMREAMRGLVPDELRWRETKGTHYFFTQLMVECAGGLAVLDDLADVRLLADLGLVEPRPFREFFETFKVRPSDQATYDDLWHVLSVEAFLRQCAGERRARA